MSAPHRKTPPTAQLTLEIDGVPYTAQVTLTVGRPVQVKRSTALTVVQPQAAKTEHTLCVYCAKRDNSAPYQCAVRGGAFCTHIPHGGRCEFYEPSLLTRLLRAFRLGRAPVYLASPKPAEQDSSERRSLRTNPLD